MVEAKHTEPRYEELDTIELPTAIPEIGVGAGHVGIIVDRHGDMLVVEVSDDEGHTLDLVDMRIHPALRVVRRWQSSDR